MAPTTTLSGSALTHGYTDDEVTAGSALVALGISNGVPPASHSPEAWTQGVYNTAQALLAAYFPQGTERIPTQATSHLCGLYAIRNSIEASVTGIPVPTVAELQEVAQSPEVNVSRTSNFYESELARILHRWGRTRGLNLHMGFLQYDGPPTLSGLEGLDAEDAQVFWIYNDNAVPEGSLNPLGILNHWSGVQRRGSLQAENSPGELAPDDTSRASTSGRSSSSQLTSSQSSSSQSSSSESTTNKSSSGQSSSTSSSSTSSSSGQSHSGRSTRATPVGIPSAHSADHASSPQPITAQPASSSPVVSKEAPSPRPSPVAIYSPLAQSPETHSPEVGPALVQPEARTEPRRSNRVAKATAKAETQPLDAQKLRPPHDYRYFCPIDGCKGSANSLADLNRFHRAKNHASRENFEAAETVDWLEWLAGSKFIPDPCSNKADRL